LKGVPAHKRKESGTMKKMVAASIDDIKVIEFVFHTANSETSRFISKDTHKTIVFKRD